MARKLEFSISEIAKMFSISRDTLLYYDKIGLFEAEGRKENNYRSYDARQLQLLDVIVNLRDLGLPIKTIKEFTKERSPESFLKLADEAVKNIEVEIRKLKERERLLKSAINEIKPAHEAKHGEIVIAELKDIPISLGDVEDHSASIFLFDSSYEKFMTNFQVPWTEIAGMMFTLDSLEMDDYTKKTRLFSKSGVVRNALIPKGLYAISYNKGNWRDTAYWNRKIVKEIEEMGYKATGPCYEEYPVAHLVTDNEDEFITKISIKIEK